MCKWLKLRNVEEKKSCPFLLLDNSRWPISISRAPDPFSPPGTLEFLSICLGIDSLTCTLTVECWKNENFYFNLYIIRSVITQIFQIHLHYSFSLTCKSGYINYKFNSLKINCSKQIHTSMKISQLDTFLCSSYTLTFTDFIKKPNTGCICKYRVYIYIDTHTHTNVYKSYIGKTLPYAIPYQS